MTRLAFQLSFSGDDYLSAASRIRGVEVVPDEREADAVVGDGNTGAFGGGPVLWVGGGPMSENIPTGKTFPAFPWRFDPHVRAVRECAEAGSLGKLGLLRMHVWATVPGPADDAAKLAGIDLALWLIGEEANAVHVTGNAQSEIFHLGFEGGAMALVDFANALPDGDGYRSLCLIGSRGAAYADDHRDRNLVFAGGAPEAEVPDTKRAFVQPMLEDFVEAVRDGRSADRAWEDYRKAENIVHRSKP